LSNDILRHSFTGQPMLEGSGF